MRLPNVKDLFKCTQENAFLTESEAKQLNEANLQMWRDLNEAKKPLEFNQAIRNHLHNPDLEELLTKTHSRTTIQVTARIPLLHFYRLLLIEETLNKSFRQLLETLITKEFKVNCVKKD